MIKRLANRARQYLLSPLYTHPVQPAPRPPDASAQVALMQMYRDLKTRGGPFPRFQDVGFQAYSQVDEDGILLYIFSLIGTTDKRAVEMCAGAGYECNTANLILNHRWTGLLFDGDAGNVSQATRFFARSNVYVFPPQCVRAWITRDNVNSLIAERGFSGEIDLFSLDVDGVDYWLWEALDVVSPRVVVCEIQGALGPERCCAMPYDAQHRASEGPNPDFIGASVAAFVKLAGAKGYRYVGCNGLSFNAFFVRNDVGTDVLPEADYRDLYLHPKAARYLAEHGPLVADLPWQNV